MRLPVVYKFGNIGGPAMDRGQKYDAPLGSRCSILSFEVLVHQEFVQAVPVFDPAVNPDCAKIPIAVL